MPEDAEHVGEDQQVPSGNPFSDKIAELRGEGLSWSEIQARLEAAWDMVDKAAAREASDDE